LETKNEKKGINNQRLDVYLKFLGAASFLKSVHGSVVNDKDPGNVSVLDTLMILALPSQLTTDSFQNYLDFFGMSYKIANMNEFFTDVLTVFAEVDVSHFNAEPTSVNTAGQYQAALKIQTGDIVVCKALMTPVTQKILVSKHVGFQAQYDADIQKGYPNFLILSRAIDLIQKF